MNLPCLQGMQRLQLPPNHPTATRSPTANPSTPSPNSAIVPAISCPGVSGQVMFGKPPTTKPWSVPQTPQAATVMRTRPGPGGEVSTSTRVNGALADATCTALWEVIADPNAGTAALQGTAGILGGHGHHPGPIGGRNPAGADAGLPGPDQAHRLFRGLVPGRAAGGGVHRVGNS